MELIEQSTLPSIHKNGGTVALFFKSIPKYPQHLIEKYQGIRIKYTRLNLKV
jgi:hypothetical protein